VVFESASTAAIAPIVPVYGTLAEAMGDLPPAA